MQEAGQEMANESQFCQTLNYMIDQSTASIQRATDNQQELNEKFKAFLMSEQSMQAFKPLSIRFSI